MYTKIDESSFRKVEKKDVETVYDIKTLMFDLENIQKHIDNAQARKQELLDMIAAAQELGIEFIPQDNNASLQDIS